MKLVRKSFSFGNQTVTLETGRIAKQATSSVLVTIDKTVVLVTVVAAKEANPGQDFFPLTVNYQEKTYATGRIPGGFQKREGKPSEKETLTSRLIDRPIRPLFPDGFNNEVQIVATVISACKNQDPDIAALLGTSAALAISGIPFNGPIGAARVGYSNQAGYLLNPSYTESNRSLLEMVVAGTEQAVLMVESEAKELPEDLMLGAVLFGHEEMQTAIKAINAFAIEVGNPKWDWQPPEKNRELNDTIKAKCLSDIGAAYKIADKASRYARIDQIKSQITEEFQNKTETENSSISETDIKNIIGSIEKTHIREEILAGRPRIDGRDTKTVRPISVEVGLLPSTHGSALFTRGETQALVVATLGGTRDAQLIDALEGERKDNFMLHYNFPPYSVGEIGYMSGPKRREIGHGNLARRGVQAVLPSQQDFPYVIRVVSEITESNGSSSMATVCGTSLALMDAGVPLKKPVAGVAMGLIKEGDRFAVLTDILGDEDHLGDMDFKVAGTDVGVTALQMDIKIDGITEEIMEIALNQARDGRLHILNEMNKVLSLSRTEVSPNAPYTLAIQINPEKIRDIIGKGGATIRKLSEDTQSAIDIDDNGTVRIYGESKENAMDAYNRIRDLTTEVEPGQMYLGTVTKIVDFGAFVAIPGGKEGLIHISQISSERVENVNDYLKVGQEVSVMVKEIDNRGRIKLSMKS